VLATLVAGPFCACDARSLVPDAGTGTGGGGGAGAGGTRVVIDSWPNDLLSNFEDLAGATIVRAGSPPRNGYWYAYADGSPTCIQSPDGRYVGEPPPVPPPQTSGGFAGSLSLHGLWSGCTTWGAGIGADINTPVVPDGEVYLGPKVPYDLSLYSGITFFAMAAPGSDTRLRLKVLTRTTTRSEEGGACDESTIGAGKCGDHYGELFDLPGNGTWKKVTVTFSEAAFRQEGWGAWFPFVPRDVMGIQIQSVDLSETYDFWIDDMYLLP